MRKTTSTNYENEQTLHEFCSAAFTLSVISGRWKLTILVKLMERELRYGELKHAIPGITERVLALQLKALEEDQLLLKISDDTSGHLPMYSLSPLGRSLEPVIRSLSAWGTTHQPIQNCR
ncbi:transcriptional regulator [Pedobacter sp. KBW06]|uniref:winged helix-turn-helix transcriptional regulator n=1 Tax=Pedobacter sp. KBW06 TaxID=2153359 RepID=UPI000F5B13C4|nr:helix-turn-helix domain-containing protein [Pedobacter sp. KBW06]RQO69983.1 transcriptional regulator [Pedobacter sp. KBW06]